MLSLSRAKSDDMRHASRFTVVVSGFPGWFLCDIAAAKSLKEYISKYRANSMNRILNDCMSN